MQTHAILDAVSVAKEYVEGGKVGTGVHTQRDVRGGPPVLKETQQDAKTTDKKPEVNDLGVNLQFAVDKETGRHLIKVLDPQTGDIIRQFPPEEFLHAIKNLRNMKGLLLSARL